MSIGWRVPQDSEEAGGLGQSAMPAVEFLKQTSARV